MRTYRKIHDLVPWVAAVGLWALISSGPAGGSHTFSGSDGRGERAPTESTRPDSNLDDVKIIADLWYVLAVDGVRTGSVNKTIKRQGGTLQTESQTRLHLMRGPLPIVIETRTQFKEHTDGRPIRIEHEQVMAEQPLRHIFTFSRNAVVHVAEHGDRRFENELKRPDGRQLSPQAARRLFLERQAAGATDISYMILHAEGMLEPVLVRHEFQSHDEYEINGRCIPVTTWRTTRERPQSAGHRGTGTVSAVERYSTDGYLVYQRIESGLGVLVTRMSSREDATAPFAEHSDCELPQLFSRTLVKPDKQIERIESTIAAEYRIRPVSDASDRLLDHLIDLPTVGGQRVERDESDGSMVVRIDLIDPVRTDPPRSFDHYTKSELLIDASDPYIIELTKRALRDIDPDSDDSLRAETLRLFVYRHIEHKSLALPFSTASEAARGRIGDCAEHALLLCAMLRAADIPARFVTGLMYTPEFTGRKDVFGWHMWTQAWLDDRWVDLDASRAGHFHAGYITVDTHGRGTGLDSALGAALHLMGNVEIHVESVHYDSQ